jgi:hypothetical protein
MIGSVAGMDSLTGIFDLPLLADEIPPVDILAGFDAVVQFSPHVLQAQVIRSLREKHLSELRAFVPWGTVSVPTSLLSSLPPNFRYSLEIRGARLELRLVGPFVAGLHWPIEVPGPADAPTSSNRRARRMATDRVVDIGWRLEINVLTARPPGDIATRTASPRGGISPPSSGEQLSGSVIPPLAMDGGMLSPTQGADNDDGRWRRSLLAFGHAITAAKAELVNASNFWRFGMELDFSEISPAVTSDDEGVTAFVASEAGKNMLEQALASLKVTAGVKLTPEVAPGGNLSARLVQQYNLPPFRVRDALRTDTRGNPVLCLCAELGTGGVTRLVHPLLEGQDFAYAVSTEVLALALRAHWNIAGGLSLISEIPIELQVSADSDETETGRARLSIRISEILIDVAIQAGTDNRGDPLRLLSSERIQLLNLWKQNGEQISDAELGPLKQPQHAPLILPLYLFDRAPSAPPQLQANFEGFLLQLIAIIVMPVVQPLSVGRDSFSGFASSAMKAMLVRWSLKSIRDDIRPPSGATEESP